MSVSIALMWGVVNYNVPIPSNVAINFCNTQGTCMPGSGSLTRTGNGLRVTGSVNINTSPFTIDSINVVYSNNKIFEVTGVNKLIDYTGSVTVDITEQWIVSLPLQLTLDGPTTVIWQVTAGPITYMYLVKGIQLTNLSVNYYDANGNVVYTDSSPSISVLPNTSNTNCLWEQISTSGQSMQSVKICQLAVIAGGQTIWQAQAQDPTQCLDLSPSLTISAKGYTCTTS
jgi:hypothetical protein